MSTKQNMFLKSLFYNGIDISITVTSGTTCPCSVKYKTYSPEWHALNPTAENCNGTLKIAETVTTYSAKGVILNKQETIAQYNDKFRFIEIGKYTDTELILIGAVNTVDMSFINLKNFDSDEDNIRMNTTITISNQAFIINHIYDIKISELFYQVALLKRKP